MTVLQAIPKGIPTDDIRALTMPSRRRVVLDLPKVRFVIVGTENSVFANEGGVPPEPCNLDEGSVHLHTMKYVNAAVIIE